MKRKFNGRGFAPIIGRTVERVDTTAVNVAVIYFNDGTSYAIHAENSSNGIPVIECQHAEEGGWLDEN